MQVSFNFIGKRLKVRNFFKWALALLTISKFYDKISLQLNDLIKSGGETGSMKPRQPIRESGKGANSKQMRQFSECKTLLVCLQAEFFNV